MPVSTRDDRAGNRATDCTTEVSRAIRRVSIAVPGLSRPGLDGLSRLDAPTDGASATSVPSTSPGARWHRCAAPRAIRDPPELALLSTPGGDDSTEGRCSVAFAVVIPEGLQQHCHAPAVVEVRGPLVGPSA